MRHHKYNEVLTLCKAGIPVLLTGEKGSGKTTLVKQVADSQNLKFFTISMTRQTTLSHLLGFMSVNGSYIPSQLRVCAEEGGIFLLDEIDAADPNVLLALNTIENGYISFPTGIVELHKNFRLMATANPQNEHNHYTGRSKLDAATLDRFDIVDVDRDENLERTLIDSITFNHINIIRSILFTGNATKVISMRDSLRFQRRRELGIVEDFVYRLVDKNKLWYESYNEKIQHLPKYADQSECNTISELIELAKTNAGVLPILTTEKESTP